MNKMINAILVHVISQHIYVLGIPDMVLMWRAIIRRTYDVIQRYIKPTTVARTVLSEEDAKQIEQTEQNEGRLQAVDQLLNKLIKLNDMNWTNLLPIVLKKHHPDVFEAVAKAKGDLLKEKWAAGIIGST